MGYAWSGKCYATVNQALDGFVRDFPTSSPSGIVMFTGTPPSINSTGLITFQSGFSLISGSGSYSFANRAGTLQLPSCNYDSLGNFWAADVIFVCAAVFAFFVGFSAGQRP